MALGFSEEEAKKKIYSVSTTTYTGFGALISEELSLKVKGNRRFRVLDFRGLRFGFSSLACYEF